MAIEARAYSNDDDAFIAWSMDAPIPGLRGFELLRRRNGQDEIVETWVGFEGGHSEAGEHRPSSEWPIQKFQWTDYLTRTGDRVQYQVVPMVGDAGHLRPEESLASRWTEPIVVGGARRARVQSYFNRGIVAAQWVSRRLGDEDVPLNEKSRTLGRVIGTPGDKVRGYLGGSLRARLLALLSDAAERKQHVFAALYELDDPELIEALLGLGKRGHVVLANGSVKKKGLDQNREARRKLRGKVEVHARMLAPRALAHNKFMVICDPRKKPLQVWTGSTNWTKTGLCTQANNGLLIHSAPLAKQYLEQWKRLRDAGADSPDGLVEANDRPRRASFGKSRITVWFTPTSEQQDLEEAEGEIDRAERAILFLMFNPGPVGTLLNSIIARGSPSSPHHNADLYVHGVVNQDPGTKKNPVQLFHRGAVDQAAYDVVLPAAVDERLAYWIKTLKKKPGAFAMVHSKVIVIDPFSSKPVVITGSHNLGPKASTKNDENLVIVRNQPDLAVSYAVHIMSIYNQYRWRFHTLTSRKAKAYSGLHDDDRWQHSYLQGMKRREMEFWVGR